MIGTRAKSWGSGSLVPVTRRLPSAIQTGSLVLTTCVKDTDPQENATEVRPLPRAWQIAAGRSRRRKSGLMDFQGDAMAPVAQPTAEQHHGRQLHHRDGPGVREEAEGLLVDDVERHI